MLERPPHTAILYATLTSPNFRPLHEFLYKASNGDGPQLEYVFRHAPPSGHASSEDRTYLSGYGVALDLKKMEYLAVDDRRQGTAYPNNTPSPADHHTTGSSAGSVDSEDTSASTYDTDPITTLLHQYPEDPAADYTTPLTEDELFSIGLEAAQLVRDADNALAALKHLAQDFPRYASTLARRVVVTDALEREITANQAKAQGGVNVIWLNGAQLGDADMNPFSYVHSCNYMRRLLTLALGSLLRLMRKERGIMKNLMSLGLNATQALDLLTHKAVGLAQSDSGVLDGLFDASDRPEGGTVIGWCNDLETDPRSARPSPPCGAQTHAAPADTRAGRRPSSPYVSLRPSSTPLLTPAVATAAQHHALPRPDAQPAPEPVQRRPRHGPRAAHVAALHRRRRHAAHRPRLPLPLRYCPVRRDRGR